MRNFYQEFHMATVSAPLDRRQLVAPIVNAAGGGCGFGGLTIVTLGKNMSWAKGGFPPGFLAATLVIAAIAGAYLSTLASRVNKPDRTLYMERFFYAITTVIGLTFTIIASIQIATESDKAAPVPILSMVFSVILVALGIFNLWVTFSHPRQQYTQIQ